MASKGHETIMRLRKEFDIPEPKDTRTKEEKERDKADALAREKRRDSVATIEEYVQKYNRDYWTDEWLGPGEDPGLPYLDESQKDIKERLKREKKEWKEKYYPDNNLVNIKVDTKEPKKVKKLRKKRKTYEEQQAWQEKVDVAYWWLECFLKPEYADELYHMFEEYEDLIEHCYEQATGWAQYMTWDSHDPKRHMSQEEFDLYMQTVEAEEEEHTVDVCGMKFKPLEIAKKDKKYIECDLYEGGIPDIPDYLWDEFDKWSDKHPLKEFKKKAKKTGFSKIALRRAKFIKMVNKRNKGFQKRMMLHDPITGSSFVSAKKMKEHYDKQMRKYEKHRKEFVKLVDDMVKQGEISEDMAIHMLGDSKEGRERVKWRHQKEIERCKMIKREAEEMRERRKRRRDKIYEARNDWFKKFKEDPNACFKVMIEGEEVTVSNIAKPGHKPLYKVDMKGCTRYTEDLRIL